MYRYIIILNICLTTEYLIRLTKVFVVNCLLYALGDSFSIDSPWTFMYPGLNESAFSLADGKNLKKLDTKRFKKFAYFE